MLDQVIAAPADKVQATLLQPTLYVHLGEVSPIGVAEILADFREADSVTQRIRLRFTGRIDPPASRFVDSDKLTWVQETVTDLESRHTTVHTVPDRYGWLLSFEGWYELREQGPSTTVQHVEFDLRVNIPGLGRLAERGIARGLREHLSQEAALVERLSSP